MYVLSLPINWKQRARFRHSSLDRWSPLLAMDSFHRFRHVSICCYRNFQYQKLIVFGLFLVQSLKNYTGTCILLQYDKNLLDHKLKYKLHALALLCYSLLLTLSFEQGTDIDLSPLQLSDYKRYKADLTALSITIMKIDAIIPTITSLLLFQLIKYAQGPGWVKFSKQTCVRTFRIR